MTKSESTGNGKKLSVAKVVRKTRGMKAPEISLPWKAYKGESSVLGTPVFEQAALAGKLPNNRPGFLSMADHDEDPAKLVGTPVVEPDDTTVALTWNEKRGTVVVDLYAVLALRSFSIPQNSRAYIPVSFENVKSHGPSVIFHLDQVTYETIQRRGPRKKKSVEPK